MSGPSYPIPAKLGGVFQLWDTVLSQYANSPILTALIENLAVYFDPTTDFDLFYDNIWDITTANGIGLDIWGRIVGVQRVLNVSVGTYFGFAEALPGVDSFSVAPFYNGSGTTTNYALSDDAFRTLILAKALANITDCSIPAINQLLLSLFPGLGNCYVAETPASNAITYTFEFPLSAVDQAIVEQSGVIPKPAGVSSSVSIIPAPVLFVPSDATAIVTSDGYTLYAAS